ncbi:MAG: hypothetical protein Q9225_004440 [Loekoesia sp. 1 TL-2023]
MPCVDPAHCSGTFKHEKRIFSVCDACTNRHNRLLSFVASPDSQLTEHNLRGERSPDSPVEVGYRPEQKEVDTQSSVTKDVAVDMGLTRKRMLTLDEMLNPVDGKPAPKESEEILSPTGKSKILEEVGDKGKKKRRVAKDIRRRVQGCEKRESRQYALMRTRL